MIMTDAAATPTVASYGSWVSPISAASLAKGAIGVSDLRVIDGRLYWLENRPDEDGRLVIMTGDAAQCRQLTPEGFNVRSRIHEYGGASYTLLDETLYFANFCDQRLHAQALGAEPTPLTPQGYRYADMVAAPGGGLVAVREDHTDPADVKNAIVALSGEADDSGQLLFVGGDFVAYPRFSPDGHRLAWMAWDHPNMPWDNTVIYAADFGPGGLANIEVVAGGGGAESVMEPQWGPDGALYFVSDRTGFWNLYVRRGETTTPLAPRESEFARPLWALGQSSYALMDDGTVVAIFSDASGDHLVVIAPASGAVREIPLPFSVIVALHRLDARNVALLASSGIETGTVGNACRQ
jgi:WD40-like Beta Propeller Repeat